jgi:hypothetical protein
MDRQFARVETQRTEGADSRRRQLRDLLLSAADAARRGRRVTQLAGQVGETATRAVRDRVSMLLSAVG